MLIWNLLDITWNLVQVFLDSGTHRYLLVYLELIIEFNRYLPEIDIGICWNKLEIYPKFSRILI
jgi:hypothetical protein